MLDPFARNYDQSIHGKRQLSRLKLKNCWRLDSFIQSLLLIGCLMSSRLPKNREPLESVLITGIWIWLAPKTIIPLHSSTRLSITVLEVPSFHSWMASLAIIRSRSSHQTNSKQPLYAHGALSPIGSYHLALKMLVPHSSGLCPMFSMTSNTSLILIWMTSPRTMIVARNTYPISEPFFSDVIIIACVWIHTNVSSVSNLASCWASSSPEMVFESIPSRQRPY